jgi:hypothetical protein
VEVEEYFYNIFIIKFYRKRDSRHPYKFNLLTNEFNCTKIVSTCIRILMDILSRNKYASFGFLGSNTVSPNFEELRRNTKRFNIYKTAMENLVGEETFVHFMDDSHSTYLMANKTNLSVDDLFRRAKIMFEEIYPELEA